MLFLEKIIHSCLCYMLDERSILKPSITYSSLSTPYSINTSVLPLTIHRILFLVGRPTIGLPSGFSTKLSYVQWRIPQTRNGGATFFPLYRTWRICRISQRMVSSFLRSSIQTHTPFAVDPKMACVMSVYFETGCSANSKQQKNQMIQRRSHQNQTRNQMSYQ